MTAIAAGTAAVLLVTGCSSSSSSGPSGTASGGSGAPTSAPATSGGGSSGANQVSQLVKASMAAPTKIFQTTPLKSKPPAGKTMVFLECELAACADISSGVQAGAKAAGWTFKKIAFKSADPGTLITAMKQALDYHPVAVSFSGIAQPLWASEIPAYKSAGVALIPVVAGPVTTSATVPVGIGDFTQGGVSLGNWFTQDSKGVGDAVIEDVPSFPVLTEYANGIKQAVSAHCPKCKLTSFNATVPNLVNNTLVSALVAMLNKNPSIKYILSTDLLFLSALPAALKAAGITGIKIAGGQPEPSDLQNIKNGTGAAAALVSNPILGWMAVDSAARVAEGMQVPTGDGGSPQQLLTAANVTSTDLADYVLPKDYPAQFKALWHVN